ncbi:MAG TPA: hypothetical protein VEV44_12305 [Pseudoneobacillus sp.]|nr:hypothetical protein [Pseudoneobacillus sp.]
MKITHESMVKLNPFLVQKDKKNLIIEDLTTGEFYEMPEVCVAAIEKINEGLSLKEIENELKIKYPNEDVDLIAFMQQLLELQMVHELDGHIIETTNIQSEQLGFSWISPKIGKLFFNRYANIGYFILFVINIVLFIINPPLFPHFTDLFIFESMTMNMILWFLVGGVLILIHEFGHILAIRQHGFPTKLEVGHRLFLIVFETDLSLAWKLPPKKRNILYLAGLSFDIVLIFFSLFIQLLYPDAPSIVIAILKFIVLDVAIRILYQCCIYMKTDLYYVFENMTSCYNLMENAKEYVKNLLGNKRNSILFKEEKNMILLYGVLYMIGTGLSLALFVFYYIPQLVLFIRKVFPGMTEPINSLSFWDSSLVIVQIFIALSILIFSWRKKYRVKVA